MICIFCGSQMVDAGDRHTCSCGAYHWHEWQGQNVARADRWGGADMSKVIDSLAEKYLDDTYDEYKQMRRHISGSMCWTCDNAVCTLRKSRPTFDCKDYIRL